MENRSINIIDIMSIASFLIALENLDMNITQEDMQGSELRLYKALTAKVDDVHKHLEDQDKKLSTIIAILKENGGVIHDS